MQRSSKAGNRIFMPGYSLVAGALLRPGRNGIVAPTATSQQYSRGWLINGAKYQRHYCSPAWLNNDANTGIITTALLGD